MRESGADGLKEPQTVKMIWVAIVLHASASSCSVPDVPAYIGIGTWAHSTEEACQAEAEKIKAHMLSKGHPIDVKCERLPLND